MQLKEESLTTILKDWLDVVGIPSEEHAHKSLRGGMACSVLANQRFFEEGQGGVVFADAVLTHIEIVGRWGDPA